MLVTFTSRGAAVNRIELSGERYHEQEFPNGDLDRSGYLGHVTMDDGGNVGAIVRVVGTGTPAAAAGLQVGDSIRAVDGVPIVRRSNLDAELRKTKPGQTVLLSVVREGKPLNLSATLDWHPLQLVAPEKLTTESLIESETLDGSPRAPASYLMALEQIDDQKAEGADEVKATAFTEIPGAELRDVNWEVFSKDQEHITFRRVLPAFNLEVRKTFRLKPAGTNGQEDPGYALGYDVEIHNLGQQEREIVYQLEGPNGLPREGWWYGSKVGREWTGGVGLRDVLVSLPEGVRQLSPYKIIKNEIGPWRVQVPIDFIAVDAQYFTSALIPHPESPGQLVLANWRGLHYGDPPKDYPNLANTSFRVQSTPQAVKPGDASKQTFDIFAGPKVPAILEHYGLSGALEYGWFPWAAKPMQQILHWLYFVTRNYGLAIILLTVLVRLAMFPLSRKQALSMQKMQELQPEIKRLQERYKGNYEELGRAQRELYRKHKFNPAGGCLIMFVQLPVFIGLYRALMVDVELRQAPLISESIRWASNLAAPDMLFYWGNWMPAFVVHYLGPYFNILPVISVVLFLMQQKMFTPPAADEQQAMQQKMMKYMMVFMGVLFFKVASGLCLYFIVSSLWGLAERKFLPKSGAAAQTSPVAPRPPSNENGAAARKNKKRTRK
jgi:YidC/Oxa1 family membrane protein insertase